MHTAAALHWRNNVVEGTVTSYIVNNSQYTYHHCCSAQADYLYLVEVVFPNRNRGKPEDRPDDCCAWDGRDICKSVFEGVITTLQALSNMATFLCCLRRPVRTIFPL